MEIGIDIIEIEKFDEKILSKKNFLNKVYTEKEIQYCNSKPNPSQHFAARFAAKEAAIKALSNYANNVPLTSLEILNDDQGKPFINIKNFKIEDIELKISISHSKELAIAIVIAYKCKSECFM